MALFTFNQIMRTICSMETNKNTLPSLFLKLVAERPNSNIIGYFDDDKIKFLNRREYKNIVSALSLALISKGVKKQDKVCIMANTCKEWHLLDIATMCAGSIVVPLYQTLSKDDADYIVRHCEANVVVIESDEMVEKILPSLEKNDQIKFVVSIKDLSETNKDKIVQHVPVFSYKELLAIGTEESKSNPDLFEIRAKECHEEDIGTIIYTSGTTGQPKGAVIRQNAIVVMLDNIHKFAHDSFTTQDRTLCYLPLSHVFGRAESFMPIRFGWECVYVEQMETLIDRISIARPSVMCAVPRVLEKIYDRIHQTVDDSSSVQKSVFEWANKVANDYFDAIDEDKTPKASTIIQYQMAKKLVLSKIYNKFGGNIRYFISGGAPLAVHVIKFLRNIGLTVLEGYGLTETVAPCTLNPLSKQVPGTVGRPLSDVQIEFLDDGEILIKSQALLTEYYKEPDKTAESFKDGFFCTGDIGHFDKDGFLKITGRKKEIIITSGGKNVAPQKIENLMKQSPLIDVVATYGDQKKYLTALIGINQEALVKRIKKLNKDFDETISFSDLCQLSETYTEVMQDIERYNTELARFETLKENLYCTRKKLTQRIT